MQGKKVTKLKAGTSYRFVISDRSSIHDFHLSGPGFNRVLTGVRYTGTKSFLVKLQKGSYRFVCDPHSASMRGRFWKSRRTKSAHSSLREVRSRSVWPRRMGSATRVRRAWATISIAFGPTT